jgi:hypothetical protein
MKPCPVCGIIPGEALKVPNRKTNMCKVCRKVEVQELYAFKKDVYNANRRLKRNKQPETKECLVCLKEFETTRSRQILCEDENCKKEWKKV